MQKKNTSGDLISTLWLGLLLLLVQPACDQRSGENAQYKPLTDFIIRDIGDTGRNNKKLIIVIAFSDFSCHLCYEDFLLFTKMINTKEVAQSESSIRVYVRQEGKEISSMENALGEWAETISIGYPTRVLPDSLLANVIFSNGKVFVFDDKWEIVKQDSFPFGGKRAYELVKTLTSK